MPGIFDSLPDGFDQQLLRGFFALAPGFDDHASETAAGTRDLKQTVALRERVIDVVHLFGEQIGLIERGVGGSLNHAEHDSLIFLQAPVPATRTCKTEPQAARRSPTR